MLESARQFHWPVDAAVDQGSLKVVRLDPRETRQSLHRVQGELGKELSSLGAQRIVVDSVSLLNMLSDDEPSRRATLFALAGACRQAGATTVLTAEADPLHPEVSRDGLSEYVSDGVAAPGVQHGTGRPPRRAVVADPQDASHRPRPDGPTVLDRSERARRRLEGRGLRCGVTRGQRKPRSAPSSSRRGAPNALDALRRSRRLLCLLRAPGTTRAGRLTGDRGTATGRRADPRRGALGELRGPKVRRPQCSSRSVKPFASVRARSGSLPITRSTRGSRKRYGWSCAASPPS